MTAVGQIAGQRRSVNVYRECKKKLKGLNMNFCLLLVIEKSLFKKKISMPFYKSVKSSLRD